MALKDFMAITCLSYNSLEYLRLFMRSYERFAHGYKMVMVIDGSTDGSKEYAQKYNNPDVSFIVFDKNRGQPDAFNAGLKYVDEVLKYSHSCILNDDMAFSPLWDVGIEDVLKSIKQTDHISLNLAEPFEGGSFPLRYVHFDPDTFDLDAWAAFSTSPEAKNKAESTSNNTPGFPIVFPSALLKEGIHFDPIYAGGGVLDTDFRLQLMLLGSERHVMKRNFFFHFSGGSTIKIKKAGKWVEFGGPTCPCLNKWGVGVGIIGGLLLGVGDVPKSKVDELRSINKEIYSKQEWNSYWKSVPIDKV